MSSRTSSLAVNRENDEHDPSHNVSYATRNGYEVPVSLDYLCTQRRSVAFFTRRLLLFLIFDRFHAPNPPSKEEIDAF